MKLKPYIKPPMFFGNAYFIPEQNLIVYHPIPFNFIAGYIRRLYYFFMYQDFQDKKELLLAEMMEWLADHYGVEVSEVKEWPIHILDDKLEDALNALDMKYSRDLARMRRLGMATTKRNGL